jgi:hypothetical protein
VKEAAEKSIFKLLYEPELIKREGEEVKRGDALAGVVLCVGYCECV